MRVYFDASPLIFLVERVAPYVGALLSKVTQPGFEVVISDLGRMECLVRAIQTNNVGLIRQFHTYFNACELAPLNSTVFDRAAEIRAQFGFKAPDAIHLAAAVNSSCDGFLTNDQRLGRFTGIPIEFV